LRQGSGHIDRAGYGSVRTGHAPGSCQYISRTDQRLAGDAPPERALAADQLALDDGDVQAAFGAPTSDNFTSRTGADYHDVEFVHLRSCRNGFSPRRAVPEVPAALRVRQL
jgi:hypothetical protein